MIKHENLTFGEAVEALKHDKKVTRPGWNGKGMWLEMTPDAGQFYRDRPLQRHILMATNYGTYVPWLASQTDILAEDWQIL